MKEYKIGDEIRFVFKWTICVGTIVGIEGEGLYTVSFVYKPGTDAQPPESVIYTITKKDIL